MIRSVIETSVRRLLHNRIELMLMFAMPIAFFSIFALIFGSGVAGATKSIKVVVVDEARSPFSERLSDLIRVSTGLRPMRDEDDRPIDRDKAESMVRTGSVAVAIVLRQSTESPRSTPLPVDLLSDSSDPVASQVVSAIVGRALSSAVQPSPVQPDAPENPPVANESPINVIDVMGEGKSNPIVSMYAAGIAVMFLLFNATSGGGALLEERENETLDRLLSTHLSMDELLLGKWFYLSAMGMVQVTLMFLWGQLLFGVNLTGHLDGFIVMTVVTSGAAAAFGLLLATLCKTRGQLNGLSVILILTMSALGGSMVPRYVMSPELREVGLYTFNAWALDGYDKVFWRELPIDTLSPQVAVLLASGFVFLVIARVFAIRWEAN